jgi:hypothetical protein
MSHLLFHPALHPGMYGWDEYLFIGLGLLALILIATIGGKPAQKPTQGEDEVVDEESGPDEK